MQIFVKRRLDSSEEIFVVFIFMECGMLWPHPYWLMWHLRSVCYDFVGTCVFCTVGGWFFFTSTILEGRQTIENHLVHMGTQRMHIMTSSISIFFCGFYFCGSRSVHKKFCTQQKISQCMVSYGRQYQVWIILAPGPQEALSLALAKKWEMQIISTCVRLYCIFEMFVLI